jgi:NAD-dependent SIR2 family protein deacetylase
MSVITTTRALPKEIHLHQLPAHIHTQFTELMDRADWYADHRELSTSQLLHAQAAELIGMRLPASGELARCTCQGCYCTCAFDAAHARTYTDGTVEFVQCPQCADEHRLTGDE